MPFQRALTPSQEHALVVDWTDGIIANDLMVKYGISNRTVMRILADAGVSRTKGPRRRRVSDRREKKPRVLKPCGTNAAYQRHKRKGEYPCVPCIGAHTRDNKEYQNGSKSEGSN